jgi:hypothetical protein
MARPNDGLRLRTDQIEEPGRRRATVEQSRGAAPEEAVLALQRSAGNAAVQRLLAGRAPLGVYRNPFSYTGTGREQGGEVTVTVNGGGAEGTITAEGFVIRASPPLFTMFGKGFGAGNPERHAVSGSLKWELDDRDAQRVVIGTIKATPKGTGVGMLLCYHLAETSAKRGITTIGTDLSALEEGTPEFYQSLGLEPSAERRQIADEAVGPMPTATAEQRKAKEAKRKDIAYSARLDGKIATVLANAQTSAFKKWKLREGAQPKEEEKKASALA